MSPGWRWIPSTSRPPNTDSDRLKGRDPVLPVEVMQRVAEVIVETLHHRQVLDDAVTCGTPHPKPREIIPLLQASRSFYNIIIPILYSCVTFVSTSDLPRLFDFLTRPAISSYDHLQELTVAKMDSLQEWQGTDWEEDLVNAWTKLGKRLKDRNEKREKGIGGDSGEGDVGVLNDRKLALLKVGERFMGLHDDCFTVSTLHLRSQMIRSLRFELANTNLVRHYILHGDITDITSAISTVTGKDYQGETYNIRLAHMWPGDETKVEALFEACKPLADLPRTRSIVISHSRWRHFFCPDDKGHQYAKEYEKIRFVACEGDCPRLAEMAAEEAKKVAQEWKRREAAEEYRKKVMQLGGVTAYTARLYGRL